MSFEDDLKEDLLEQKLLKKGAKSLDNRTTFNFSVEVS
jgi:hypothetical protein